MYKYILSLLIMTIAPLVASATSTEENFAIQPGSYLYKLTEEGSASSRIIYATAGEASEGGAAAGFTQELQHLFIDQALLDILYKFYKTQQVIGVMDMWGGRAPQTVDTRSAAQKEDHYTALLGILQGDILIKGDDGGFYRMICEASSPEGDALRTFMTSLATSPVTGNVSINLSTFCYIPDWNTAGCVLKINGRTHIALSQVADKDGNPVSTTRPSFVYQS